MALVVAIIALTGAGCHSVPAWSGPRQFDFRQDTFHFANELVWEYGRDGDGNWTHQERRPAPAYTQHCVALSRAARQFFAGARFDPDQPRPTPDGCRRLIRAVMAKSPRHPVSPGDRILIPGYANLREFSLAEESLLKEGCGGSLESYFQRGNWRMVFPFARSAQEAEARRFADSARRRRPVVVHLVTFPSLALNHTVLLFAVNETAGGMEFEAYDPNLPDTPQVLTFDRGRRRFHWPASTYFQGGEVNAYEIFSGVCD